MDDNKYLNVFDDPEFTKTELGKTIFVNHIHECVFRMFYKKKIAKKKCKAYLTSIGEKNG